MIGATIEDIGGGVGLPGTATEYVVEAFSVPDTVVDTAALPRRAATESG